MFSIFNKKNKLYNKNKLNKIKPLYDYKYLFDYIKNKNIFVTNIIDIKKIKETDNKEDNLNYILSSYNFPEEDKLNKLYNIIIILCFYYFLSGYFYNKMIYQTK
jgi:hypothetical protein